MLLDAIYRVKLLGFQHHMRGTFFGTFIDRIYVFIY